MTNICITAFKWVPPVAQGLVRDLRVRWALEEAGLPYTEKLLAPGDQDLAAHRAVQPFGQVPVYEEGELTLFESGSILLHLGEKSEVLLPADPVQRARARTWMFAALNSVEPHVQNLTTIDLLLGTRTGLSSVGLLPRSWRCRASRRSPPRSRDGTISRAGSRRAICSWCRCCGS